MPNKTRFFVLTSMVALAVLTGCRGAVVIVPGPRCRDEAVQVCHDYRDRWGHWHRECRIEYRQRCWSTVASLKNPVGPVALGSEFGISYDSAERMIDIAVKVNQGDYSQLKEMGLSDLDLIQLGRHELPSNEGIEAIANAQDQDASATRELLSTILAESRENLKSE